MSRWRFIGKTPKPPVSNDWIVVDEKIYEVKTASGECERQLYYVVTRKPFVLVVAIYRGELLMVRHFRQGTDKEYLELPAGYLNDQETPVDAGARELREETGFVARNPRLIGELHPLPGYINSAASVVLCTDVAPGGSPTDRDEIEGVERFPFETAVRKVVGGEVNEMQAVAAILLAKAVLSE